MPDEIVALLIVAFILTFVVTVILSTQRYRLRRLEREAGDSGDTLTTSELQEMIEAAVNDATAPLREKLNLVSARLDEVEGVAVRLDLPEDEEVPEKTVGRQSKQRQQ